MAQRTWFEGRVRHGAFSRGRREVVRLLKGGGAVVVAIALALSAAADAPDRLERALSLIAPRS